MFLIFVLLALVNADNVFDEYNKRAKQASKELLVEHLKRQNSIRLLSKVSSSSLTYNDILEGLINQNIKEIEGETVSAKRTKQVLDKNSVENEQKRMEFLRRLAQNEIDADHARFSELTREYLMATASRYSRNFDDIQQLMRRKWKQQRKALIMLEHAREAKHKWILESIKDQQNPSYETKKAAEFYMKSAEKKNKIALKAITHAKITQSQLLHLFTQKQSEIKRNAVKNAQKILKQSQRIRKFNMRDELY